MALVATIGFVLSCRQNATADRFEVVTGPEFEGAIVPSAYVPASFRLDDETAWTPSAEDVRRAERKLLEYLESATLDPAGVEPPIVFRPDHPPRDRAELRAVLENLPQWRRQYFGIARGAARMIVISSFPKEADFGDWRNQIIAGGYDHGCGLWSARFDIAATKLVQFSCQGEA